VKLGQLPDLAKETREWKVSEETTGLVTVVMYLVLGAALCRQWPTFEASGKLFLWLFFPAHTLIYLICASIDVRKVARGVLKALMILLLAWFFLYLVR
jgi:hypothetical protein